MKRSVSEKSPKPGQMRIFHRDGAGDTRRMRGAVLSLITVGGVPAALSGCGDAPDGATTVVNMTNQNIRLTGDCVDDPVSLAPGESSKWFYSGSECRVDDGDGVNGLLGCLHLNHHHIAVTRQTHDEDHC